MCLPALFCDVCVLVKGQEWCACACVSNLTIVGLQRAGYLIKTCTVGESRLTEQQGVCAVPYTSSDRPHLYI